MEQLKEQIRALIVRDETDEALDALLEWSKSHYLRMHEQCILLRARLEQIERETNTNLISPEESRRQVGQINAALLNLITDLDNLPVTNRSIPDSAPVQQRRNSWLLPVLMGALVVAVGSATYLYFGPSKSLEDNAPAAAVPGTLRFPEGKRAVLVENSNEIAYEIIGGRIERLHPEQQRLVLQIRCLPKTAYQQDVNFWSRNFRLECPGLPPLAPSNDLNLLAKHGAHQDGAVEFLLPHPIRSAKLLIQLGTQSTGLPISW